MINRISAAFIILLAYVILLAHSMILHHHHNYLAVENSSQIEFDDNHSHHDGSDHHSHKPLEDEHDNPLKKHDHSFPQHSHTLVSSDFTLTLINQSISSKQFTQTVIIIFSESELCDIYSPPDIKYDYGNSKFRITSLFEPGAIALRGPPAIA